MKNESILDLPPDLYSRNYIISKGISEYKKQKGLQKVKILDIGGVNGRFGDFIDPGDELVIVDIRESSEPNSFIGDATSMTMFKDKSFDIVISGDVFEHIPQNQRNDFISESLRVAKYLVIHAAPFENEYVSNCELLIRDFFRETVGYDHKWLKEHCEEGLPNKQDFENLISDKGYTFVCIGSNNIFNWLLIQYFDILKFSFGISPEEIKEIHKFYNSYMGYLETNNDIFYRYVYFITKESFRYNFDYKLNIRYIHLYESKILEILNKSHADLKKNHVLTIKTLQENEILINKIMQEKVTLENNIFEYKNILLAEASKIQDKEETITELQEVVSAKTGEIQDKEETITELQKIVSETKLHNEKLRQNVKDLENAIFSIQSTRSWKVVDFIGCRYCLIRHYFVSIKQEIENKGIIRGLYASFILFLIRVLKLKIKLRISDESANDERIIVPKVVFLSGCDGDTRRYRVFHQQEELKHNGIPADVFDFYDINLQSALNKYEIFILHRVPITPEYEQFIIEGNQKGKKFIFETDDLIFHEKYAEYIHALDEMSAEQVELYHDGLRRFNKTMQLCDYAICSTEYLKSELESYGKIVYINLNAVSDEMVRLAKNALANKNTKEKNKVTIGYFSGTKTHNLDFKVAEDTLIRILKEFENVELVIGGFLDLSDKFSQFTERIIRLPFMDWRELPKYIVNIDINISPLENTPFCNAKSDLKFFEAALLKVPTIASNVGGNKSQIRPFENGLLVSTSEEWYDALKLLITDKELRTKIGKNAESDILKNRTTKIIGENLVKILQEIEKRSIKQIIKSPLSGLYSDNEWPTFSIISILFNKEHEVKYFLESFFLQRYKGNFEIIFVDDCSTDSSVQVVTNFIKEKSEPGKYISSPEIKILKNSNNLGNCISRNIGLNHAKGELCVIIDADCIVNRDFLTRHAEAYKFNDVDISIGPFNLETNQRDPIEVLRLYENNPENADQDCQLQDPINKKSFLNCITRNFCIKRDFITEDLFDPKFSYSKNQDSGFGWEDIEMGYRLYHKGARIAYISNAFSIHISHPSSIEEKEKSVRSIRNFKKLYVKHPDLLLTNRRWTLDTYSKITNWLDANQIIENDDRKYLNNKFQRFLPPPFYILHNNERKLKILTYRWHCAHQYELFKLPFEFTLVRGLGTGITEYWEYDKRPLPENVTFEHIKNIDIENYDLAIMPFDENVLSPDRTNGIIRPEWRWGDAFKWFIENVTIPKIGICHGTPQFYGQYTPGYSEDNLMQPIEEERLKFRDVLHETLVINNSYQAQKEWNFNKSKVIWHGFDPTEFPKATYKKGILVMGKKAMKTRPHYNGYIVYKEVIKNFPKKYLPEFLPVKEPNKAYGTDNNWYANCKFDNYVRALGEYSIYFNPTIRSPMPRTRGEAMMCGLAIISTKSHDVELFMKNGVNGFYSDDPSELREYLLYLSENPTIAKEVGEAGRHLAMDIFNHDRYLMDWEKTIKTILTQGG